MTPVAIAVLLAPRVVGGVAAQEVARVGIPVDYVGVEGIYLAVGAEHGIEPGDTLVVYATEAAPDPLGALRFRATSRRRSVAVMLDPSFELSRGDVVFASLPSVPVTEPAGEREERAGAAVPTPGVGPARGADPPRVRGRLSLLLDARETRTSWQGDLFGTTRRRFATPTSSLSLSASDLPGGLRVEANLRGSYRYSDAATIQPTTSVRLYGLTLVKSFEAAPVELRMGRFYNPFERYSGYWDGLLLRLGGRRGPGVGIAAGLEPERGNEGLSRDVSKLTAFVDFSGGGRGWRYDTDLSFHLLHPQADSLADRSFAGWSQALSVGRLSVDQRLRLERDAATGEWTLGQLRVLTGVELAGPLRVHAAYGRSRPDVLLGLAPLDALEREEVSAGVSLFGSGGSLALDAGTTRWADDEPGRSLSASAWKDLGGLHLHASGRRWSRAGMTSLSVAPAVGFGWRSLETRWGYQLYRTDSALSLTSHSADLTLTLRATGSTTLTLRGQQQWGRTFGGTRIQARIWRSF